ncbi:ESCRT-III subunit protein did4 [Coemansia javaensis]|uniref:ESCRT-III subunit protein did4 n=1 Tax=Coemansia javaensis TaxID=2761396 RepID=A0A9W8LMK5_9FUNG|nr:ESCRT-III subunit protein did4 [Coemansia javaensis]
MFKFLFGGGETTQEKLRKSTRELRRAQRQIETEIAGMERQEKKLVADMKKAAKEGESGSCRIMAKDLVRTRRHVKKYRKMHVSLQAMGLRIQSVASNQQMAKAVQKATAAMGSMNRGMNLQGMQKVLMDFERESGVMDMKEEMINDAIDGAMDSEGEDEDEEAEEVFQKIYDEIGIQLGQDLGAVPSGLAAAQPAAAAGVSEGTADILDDDAALQARLDNLRRE